MQQNTFKGNVVIDLRQLCLELNLNISKEKLALFTWGNVSVRADDNIFIKPSGVPFEELTKAQISKVEISTGKVLSGLKPSVDTNIHMEIYKSDANVRSVIHTHSSNATMFAQARKSIPLIGTTHADYFPCDIPVTKELSFDPDANDMETSMGRAVVECAKRSYPRSAHAKAVLMASHGVMLWSPNPEKIIEYSVVLEEIAKLAIGSIQLNPDLKSTEREKQLFDFHYQRKHGKGRYYGQ